MKLQKGFHLKHLQKQYFSKNKFNERCERHWKPHEVGHYWEKLKNIQGNGEYHVLGDSLLERCYFCPNGSKATLYSEKYHWSTYVT